MDRLPERIDCPRLVLRRWRADEAELLGEAVAASLEHLRPWMAWAHLEPIGLDERRSMLETWQADWERGDDAGYGAFLDDTVVGGCGLHRRGAADVLHIGYWIHADHVRRGYARELATGLTTAAFEVPGIRQVRIHHASRNERSRAVPAALGFTFEGELAERPEHPEVDDVVVGWYVDADDWPDRLARNGE